jgi:Putative restriction endonuclease
MGNLATPEALVLRWDEVCRDPSLQDLPYKIRVPDVAWASARFMTAYGEITPYTRAPEICVEILAPSNVQAEIDEKTRAYLQAGAEEVWLVSEDGAIRYIGGDGERTKSSFAIAVSLPPPIRA